jgi:hypothetical protein
VRRSALALVTALVALGTTSAGATADPSSNVVLSATVYSSSGTSPDSVTLAALQADPTRCPTYIGPQSMNELGRQGFVPVQLTPSGPQTGTWALTTALGCLQTPIPLSAVQGITVHNPDGSTQAGVGSQLTPADLATPSDFNDSSESPVVQALGSANQFDRPWRGGSDQDFLDEVQQSQNGSPEPISIDVFEGPLLTVSVTASRTTVPAGGIVTFSATVTGQGASPLAYSWSFGGGAPASTAPGPQVRFTSEGQFAVTLQVTDTSGGGGVASIPITVGAKAPAATGRHKRSGTGTSRSSHSPTGPRKSSGKHPGGPPGSSEAPGTTSTPTAPTPSRTTTTPTSTTTTPTNTASRPVTTTARASPAPLRPGPTATTPHPLLRPRRLSKPAQPSRSNGPTVAGQLISDVVPLAPGASPLVHLVPATVASAPPARRAIRASLLPVIGAALAVLLLLGLGAARELGWRPDWRALRAGN